MIQKWEKLKNKPEKKSWSTKFNINLTFLKLLKENF